MLMNRTFVNGVLVEETPSARVPLINSFTRGQKPCSDCGRNGSQKGSMTQIISFSIDANDPYDDKILKLVEQIKAAGGTIGPISQRGGGVVTGSQHQQTMTKPVPPLPPKPNG